MQLNILKILERNCLLQRTKLLLETLIKGFKSVVLQKNYFEIGEIPKQLVARLQFTKSACDE